MNESGNWVVFFFKEKITLKHLKIIWSSEPRVRLLAVKADSVFISNTVHWSMANIIFALQKHRIPRLRSFELVFASQMHTGVVSKIILRKNHI